MTHAVPRVELTGIRKRYPGVLALDDVGFSIMPGEIHALVGENGAGKSTLVKILSGSTAPDAGNIRVDGRGVMLRGAREAWSAGIAVVFQEFQLAGDLSVADNVFLGRWPRGKFATIDSRVLEERASKLFVDLGVDIPLRARVGELSVAQRQMVEIARALSLDAKVLVLDEPSAVLTPNEVAKLFGVVRSLQRRGVSVLYISHRLDEIFELCDRVTVLRDGRWVSTRAIGEASRDLLIREMVGQSIHEEYPPRVSNPGEVVLRVERLSAAGRFQDVSFELRAGEVLALTGLVGSGRSSVGHCLFGAIAPTSGRVEVGGVAGAPRSPRDAKRRGIAMVPEDRRRQGLLLDHSIRANIAMGNFRSLSTLGVIGSQREQDLGGRWMSSLRIKAAGDGATTGTLSGGNQQKVLFARWLEGRCAVMILDEPTRGVDVGAKIEIYSIINDVAARGGAVLLITSEFAEAIGMADRIGVMAGGRLVSVLDNRARSVTQEEIMRWSVPRREALEHSAA